MPLLPIHGHGPLRHRLADAYRNGSLPASLLLTGARGIGKQRIALWLAQLMLCEESGTEPCDRCSQCRFARELKHPDIQWFFPLPRPKDADPSIDEVRAEYAAAIAERVARHGAYAPSSGTDGIFVATVRAIVRLAGMSPALAQRKVFVVGDAERMVPQEGSEFAANAFLKLLEEPAADTTIILTSSEPGALLPTIRSRVATLRVAPLADADVNAFLRDPIVRDRMKKEGSEMTLLEMAGAPGRVFADASAGDAHARARRLLDAVESTDSTALHRAAYGQGGSGARGSFSDVMDALTVALRERAAAAIARGDERAALAASRGVASVEWAKERASGNVNPQLITSRLLRELRGHFT